MGTIIDQDPPRRISERELIETRIAHKASQKRDFRRKLVAYTSITLLFVSGLAVFACVTWVFEDLLGETVVLVIASLSFYAFLYFAGAHFKNLWNGHL